MGSDMRLDVKARWPSRTLAISALGVLVVVALGLWWWQHQGSRVETRAWFKPLPADQAFLDAASSRRFRVHGTVTLRGQETPGRRIVTFEARIENKTGQPITGLLVTAKLPEALGTYADPQWLTFGGLDTVDLVPGQEPYGLIASKIENLPDPSAMTDGERRQFYDALRQPIRIGLWWKGGEEYLELREVDIDYVSFP